MKIYNFVWITISLVLGHLSVLCVSHDFSYFVQQWPGVAIQQQENLQLISAFMDFGLPSIMARGLNFSNRKNPYDQSKIPDLISSMKKGWPTLACSKNNGTKFWAHEWNKHGTWSESVLDQHAYIQASLNLKKSINLLQNLKNVGSNPDGKLYTMAGITKAITDALGFAPAVIWCNTDPSGNSQLHEIYICVHSSGSNLITCPLFLKSGCRSEIEFPPF